MRDGKFNCLEIVDETIKSLKNITNDEFHETFDDFLDCVKANTNNKNCGEEFLNASILCSSSESVIFTGKVRVASSSLYRNAMHRNNVANIECK